MADGSDLTFCIGLPQGRLGRGRNRRALLASRCFGALLLFRNPDRLSIGRSIAATAWARLRESVDVLQSTIVGRENFDVCPGVVGLRRARGFVSDGEAEAL